MQYGMMLKMQGLVLKGIVKKQIPRKEIIHKMMEEYRAIIFRAKDIGSRNNLIGSYGLAAFFIAMVRTTHFTPDENIAILEEGLKNSKAFKMMMGSGDDYFSPKKMEFRRRWSQGTYDRKYENDWVVDVLEKTEDYEFGFDYHECGVCKLCRDEKCPELARYLCRLDFMIVEMMGIHLKRTMTLAEGGEKCDFRFSR